MKTIIKTVLRKAGLRIVRIAAEPEATGQIVTIGRYTIELPSGSALLRYQKQFKRYDMALGEISYLIAQKYVDLCAIDIGANVGDTAATIRKYADIPVLCVEGDTSVVEILRRNIRQFGEDVEIEPSFISDDELPVQQDRISGAGHNASIVNAGRESGEIRTRTIHSILNQHSRFRSAKLLKIDAEGFDFRIIQNASEWLQVARPVIFFEYNPTFTLNDPIAGPATINCLGDIGYEYFLYFDNFGNYLTSLRVDEQDHMIDLHAYLLSNQRFGIVVYYFDICAVHRDDASLVSAIRRNQLNISSDGYTAVSK
jgi:FkbM family methyltransferase